MLKLFDTIHFFLFASECGSARQRRIADLGSASDAKAAVACNSRRILLDGVLQLDDLLRT